MTISALQCYLQQLIKISGKLETTQSMFFTCLHYHQCCQ